MGESTKTIAIIGGGVSGALTAYHLRCQSSDVRILIIDPRPELGLGLAYSTPSLRHLLNVPAGKISALPDDPEHFLRWLRRHHDPSASAETFAPRAVFGEYIRTLLSQAPEIEHLQAWVIALHQRTDTTSIEAVQLTLDTGAVLRADLVVLATGNFDPAPLPGIDPAAIESGAYCHHAWADATYAQLPIEAPVTLIGTGLTAVDVLLRLREVGHRGVITAVSRHAIFPSRHRAHPAVETSAIPGDTLPTCVSYLRTLRAAITGGMAWRTAVDSLRSTTNDLWLALPIREQERFRRHLQRRWDVVRHRMAPPIADVMEAELSAGTLLIAEGHVAGVRAESTGATMLLRTKGGNREVYAARAINCTGPGMNYRRVHSSLLQSLFVQGLATAGPLGGGLATRQDGALIDRNGSSSETLFNLGPGRLGTLLESIAIPEIRQQAVDLAELLVARLEVCATAEPLRETMQL